MISINNLTISFSGEDLFKDISFVVNPRDRIGLAGKNGAGKSTLLKIVCKEMEPDKGSISMPSDTTLGYLPQQIVYPEGKTVIEETLTAFSAVNSLKEKIEKTNNEILSREDYESDSYMKLIEELHTAQEKFSLLGGETSQADTEKVLKGLGFVQEDFSRKVEEFSGGWRMRIELAKILLKRPNVFLLDEPTNHLDIESIQWLEDFLTDYPGAIVLISHDRTFLDSITKRTIEISAGKIYDYKAAYSEYEILRVERRRQQLASFQNQQKMIQDTEKFIERFRYKATKSVQVQSRIKQLDKVERIEIDEEDFSNLSFRFPPAPRSGTLVVDTENLTVRYSKDAPTVLENLFFTIERGDKVAFVGKNGKGKSTLVKLIIGELAYEGILKTGQNVKIGYYAQNQEEKLDVNKTVFQTLDDIAVGDVRTKIRDILGQFLFSGEDIDKKVAVLSGGEKARLALAKLMLEPYNFLILDEPTNHLDMKSKDILKQALINYDGTMVVVSHDRNFLENLVQKIYEFDNKTIKQHSGDIVHFLQKRKLEQLKNIEKKDPKEKVTVENKKPVDNKEIYLQRKEMDKEIRKFSKQVEQIENEIEILESGIQATEKLLASGKQLDNPELYTGFENDKKTLIKKMTEWEDLQHEVAELENRKSLIN